MGNGQQAEKQGYLYKYGENIVTDAWRKRWFVLRNRKLMYYKSTQDSHAAGIIPLNDAILCCLDAEQLSFEIETPFRIYFLKASSKQDLLSWQHSLAKFITIEAISATENRRNITRNQSLYNPDLSARSMTRNTSFFNKPLLESRSISKRNAQKNLQQLRSESNFKNHNSTDKVSDKSGSSNNSWAKPKNSPSISRKSFTVTPLDSFRSREHTISHHNTSSHKKKKEELEKLRLSFNRSSSADSIKPFIGAHVNSHALEQEKRSNSDDEDAKYCQTGLHLVTPRNKHVVLHSEDDTPLASSGYYSLLLYDMLFFLLDTY